MVKFVILKSVSFESKDNFMDVTNIKYEKYLENKLKFVEFKNTSELFELVKKETNDLQVDVTICHYDTKYLIQALTVENDNEQVYSNIILFKREIHKNDTYSFSEYKNDIDLYVYVDILMEDIINILRKKTVISCVKVSTDGNISNKKIILKNRNDDVGKLITEDNKEILYLNITGIKNKNNKLEENELNELLMKKINAYYAEYLFTQIDINYCIINCFHETFSDKKNDIVSNLIKFDIYGDVILYLQSNYENDTETYLDVDVNLFNKMYNTITNNKKVKKDNTTFFNIYMAF